MRRGRRAGQDVVLQFEPERGDGSDGAQDDALGLLGGNATGQHQGAPVNDNGPASVHLSQQREERRERGQPGGRGDLSIHRELIDDSNLRAVVETVSLLKNPVAGRRIGKRAAKGQLVLLESCVKVCGNERER